MLASVQDAEDALQEALLGAWRGLGRFEGRSSLRSWLYKIATNACLRLRGAPAASSCCPVDYGPAADPHDGLGEAVLEPLWVEPYPTTPALRATSSARASSSRSSPRSSTCRARQRAVLILQRGARLLGRRGRRGAGDDARLGLQRAPARAQDRRRAPPAPEPAGDAARARRRAPARAGRRASSPRGSAATSSAVAALLTEDVTLAMPPLPDVVRGHRRGQHLPAASRRCTRRAAGACSR